MDEFGWDQGVLVARHQYDAGGITLVEYINTLAAMAHAEAQWRARLAHEANGTPLAWTSWYPGAFRDYVHDQFDPEVQATWERRLARGASPFPRF